MRMTAKTFLKYLAAEAMVRAGNTPEAAAAFHGIDRARFIKALGLFRGGQGITITAAAKPRGQSRRVRAAALAAIQQIHSGQPVCQAVRSAGISYHAFKTFCRGHGWQAERLKTFIRRHPALLKTTPEA